MNKKVLVEMMSKNEGGFVQRDVYTKYFRYTAKREGYTKFVYTTKLE